MDAEAEDIEWQELAERRGKRARRRELESVREPGHLQHYFYVTDQRWIHLGGIVDHGTWKQLMRASKHSCHLSGCVERRKFKRREAHRERQAIRRELKWSS